MPVTVLGEHAITLPVGTTAQRPTGVAGMVRFNTTTGYMEMFDSGSSSYKLIADAADIYSFSGTITFSPCGATGRMGPTLAQCRTSYTGQPFQATWLNNTNLFFVEQGVQYWVVPKDGNYVIETAGAGRNKTFDGQGAIVRSTHTLFSGELLRIVVAQQGVNTGLPANIGGHGASAVSVYRRVGNSTQHILLSIGGGGSGLANNSAASIQAARNGQYTNSGVPEGGHGSTWDLAFAAGSGLINFWPGGGGGGWLRPGQTGGIGDGVSKQQNAGGAIAFDALGGFHETLMHGGFGGGGGTGRDGGAGAGGGGYNGGNALPISGQIETGGGSYTGLGATQTNVGLRTGHGYVTIQL